jgi:aspartate/glutamate racemase
MKHAGILATTPDGAALCFRAFCQDGFAELGPHDHPDVTLDCIALARSLPAWQAGDYATVRAALSVSARRLAAAGADFFACPDNTAHLALQQPGPSLPLPGLHIAEVVAGQAARDGRQRVGVLGTGHTMTGPVYQQALAARHIATEIPGEHDRAVLDEIIISELVNGVFTSTMRQECARIIGRLAALGCDAVALACTELPLLLPSPACPLPALDSTRLLLFWLGGAPRHHSLVQLGDACPCLNRAMVPGWRPGRCGEALFSTAEAALLDCAQLTPLGAALAATSAAKFAAHSGGY